MNLGKYVVIDGIDGGGKGTLFQGLQKAFPQVCDEKDGYSFIYTREPGGTPLGERLRNEILHSPMTSFSEMCLLLAQRQEVREIVVKPVLKNGVTVISDRSDSATFAYQIRGRNLHHLDGLFWQLQAMLEPLPTLYIFLDITPVSAAKRMHLREAGGQEADKFEKKDIDFFASVRQGFFDFASKVSVPCYFVNAEQDKGKVFEDVATLIRAHLK